MPNLQADFFNQIKIGVENYAGSKGIEVVVVDAKNDTATQVSQVQDLMTQGIDAFIYIRPAPPLPPFRPASRAKRGFRLINVDRFPEEEPGDTFIGGEGVESSYQVCKTVIERAGGKGKMVIIHGQKGTTPEVDRTTRLHARHRRAPRGGAGRSAVVSNMWSPDEASRSPRTCCRPIPTSP